MLSILGDSQSIFANSNDKMDLDIFGVRDMSKIKEKGILSAETLILNQ